MPLVFRLMVTSLLWMFLCGKRELSALLFASFGYRRLVTHIQQHFDFVIWNTPIQCNGDPVIFAHVICGEETDFIPQGANQKWVTFEIDHIQKIFLQQSQLVLWNIHNDSKPLLIVAMPEHFIIGIFEPRIIAVRVICFCYKCF